MATILNPVAPPLLKLPFTTDAPPTGSFGLGGHYLTQVAYSFLTNLYNAVAGLQQGLQVVTLATLPASPQAGAVYYASNLGGGGGPISFDGTNWRRLDPGLEVQTPGATVTLTVLANAEEQYQSAVLSQNLVVTLAAAGAYAGARFRWIRAAGGAYTIAFVDQTSAATIYTSMSAATETVEAVFRPGSPGAWVVAQHSSL